MLIFISIPSYFFAQTITKTVDSQSHVYYWQLTEWIRSSIHLWFTLTGECEVNKARYGERAKKEGEKSQSNTIYIKFKAREMRRVYFPIQPFARSFVLWMPQACAQHNRCRCAARVKRVDTHQKQPFDWYEKSCLMCGAVDFSSERTKRQPTEWNVSVGE